MTDPTNVFAMDDIKFMTGYNVEPVVASETSLRTRSSATTRPRRRAGVAEEAGEESEKKPAAASRQPEQRRTLEMVAMALEDTASDIVDDDVEVLEEPDQIDSRRSRSRAAEAPVIRLVNVMLCRLQKGASDIHIEPYEKEFRVRFRIDGILYNVMAPPMKFRDAITSRIKIMAKLDIAEKRLPQDGRIKIRFRSKAATKEIDFRVSCLPTLFGEKIVLRLLDKDKLMLDMTKLGFEAESLAKLENAICQAVGHGARHRPDRQRQDQHALFVDRQASTRPDTNIMTAEDPVEFNLPGSTRSRSATTSASTSPPRCARSCGRTRTSSWSAKSATSRPRRSRSRPRSPATWCSRRCTRTTRRARSAA